MNVPAPEGSMNGVGNVIWAREPKVMIAHPPTVAWYLYEGAACGFGWCRRVISEVIKRISLLR